MKWGIDILEWNYKMIPKNLVYGILAAPPCTDFAGSGAQYWPKKDIDGRKQGSYIQLWGGKSERTKELRSVTPSGFSKAFYESNKCKNN